MGYDGRIIHRVYIKDQNKVIQVKDFRIFENFETKLSINLLDYQDKLTFEGFFLKDRKKNAEIEGTTSKQKIASSQLSQKVNHAKNTKEPSKKQKVASS